ncbi:hypothetical protein AAMO2058_000168300 [Amorphochlora amoebiformis]
MDSKEAIFDYPGSFFKSIRVVASDVVKGMEGIRKRDLKCAELRKEVKIERELHLDQIRRHTKLSRFQNKRPNRHADDQVRKVLLKTTVLSTLACRVNPSAGLGWG